MALLVFLIIFQTAFAVDQSIEVHEAFINSSDPCLECHSPEEATDFENRTSESCSEFCLTCHDPHHSTDTFVRGDTPDHIKLLNQKLVCFSCHNVKKQRFDNESWKAESMFEQMFRKKDRYPTYFLIEKNNEGQLCRRCH